MNLGVEDRWEFSPWQEQILFHMLRCPSPLSFSVSVDWPDISLQWFPGSDWPAILGMGGSKVRAQFVSDVTKGRRKEGKRKSLDYSLIRFSGRRSSESMTWTSYQVSFLLPLSKTLVPGWPFPSLFCILLYVLVLFVHVTEACGLVRAELHHLFCQTIPFSPFLGHRAHWVIKCLCPSIRITSLSLLLSLLSLTALGQLSGYTVHCFCQRSTLYSQITP